LHSTEIDTRIQGHKRATHNEGKIPMNATVKILGITDEVTTCGCCGRNGLKKTIALEIDEVLTHYGTQCAANSLRYGRGAKFTTTKITAEAKLAKAKSFYSYTGPVWKQS
jgi:hypothetical protein